MRVEVLGPARATRADGTVVTFDRRHRRVLAALAAAGGSITLDALTDAIWSGDPPAAASKTTQNLLSDLRRELGAGSIQRSGDTYRLVDVEIDAVQFGALDVATSDAAAVRDALAWWRGAAFADLDDWPPAVIERARLEELRLVLQERLAELDLAQGHIEQATADLEALVVADPYREHRWSLLVRAHTAAGRQARALATFQRARKVLVEHLGLEPGPELVAAERAALTLGTSPARPLAPLRVVGREPEREVLWRAWQRARQGSTQVVVITGEAGIAKTHLALGVAAELAGDGALVGVGRADETAGDAFTPLSDAVDDLLVAVAGHDGELARQLRAELALLLPSAEPASTPVVSELAVARLGRQLRRGLERVSTIAGVVLVLDDVHWAGPDAREPLQLLVAGGGSARALLILCARGDRRAADAVVPPEVLDRSHARSLPITGLSVEAVGQLLGTDAADRAVVYHRATAGNPLACLLLEESGWTPGADAPSGMGALVTARLRSLSVDALAFIEVAALTGLEFDAALVGAAARQSSASTPVTNVTSDAASGVADATAVGLIEAAEGGRGRHRFRHPIFRSVIEAAIPPDREMSHHAALASTLIELAPARVTDIAHHLAAVAGLDASRRDEAMVWARRAAEASERRAAFDEAASWYEAALQLHEVDDRERYELLLGQSRAMRAHPGWEFRAPACAAAQLAEESLGDMTLAGEALLAGNRDWPSAEGYVDGPYVQALETLVDRLGDTQPALRARLLAAMGTELVFDLDGWRRRRIADEALALADATADPATLIHVLCRRPAAIWDLATTDERRTAAERYLQLAPPSDVPGIVTATTAAATAAIERVDLEAAAVLLARSAALTGGLPPGHLTLLHDTTSLQLLLARGRLDEVRAAAAQLPGGGGASAATFLLGADLQEGRGGELAAGIAREIQPKELAPFASMLGAADGPEDATAALSAFPPAFWASVPPSVVRALIVGAAAYAAGKLGAREHAEALLPLLRPFGHLLLCVGHVGVLEPAALTVGRLLIVLGDPEGARAAFHQASEVAKAAGNASWRRQAGEALTGLDALRRTSRSSG